MGVPVPVEPQVRGPGLRILKTMGMAALYVLLIPLTSLAFLWCAVTYFPGPFKAVLGPVIDALAEPSEASQENDTIDAIDAVDRRLAKLEGDLALLAEQIEKGPGASISPEEGDGQGAHLLDAKSPLLAALAELTMARVEYLWENRNLALREVKLALDMLPPQSSEDLLAAVRKAAEELARGSPAAGDWLSVAWHLAVEAVIHDVDKPE